MEQIMPDPQSRPRPKALFAVRASPRVFSLFDQVHAELNSRMAYGELSRAETLELIVSSALTTPGKKYGINPLKRPTRK